MPLGTLRASIRSLRDDKESALHEIEQAFDYLELLVRSNINDNSNATDAPSLVEAFRDTVITEDL